MEHSKRIEKLQEIAKMIGVTDVPSSEETLLCQISSCLAGLIIELKGVESDIKNNRLRHKQ